MATYFHLFTFLLFFYLSASHIVRSLPPAATHCLRRLSKPSVRESLSLGRSQHFKHCSIVKNLLPVVKHQNGGYIQDGVENILIFLPIFSKIIFLSVFLLFLSILGKNVTSTEKLFLENSKWRNNLI
jgi:hypothetical protein